MDKKIITVCGSISPEKLGYTSMHEHTLSKAWKLKRVMIKSMPDMMKGAMAYEKGADIGIEMERRKQEGFTQIPQMSVKDVLSSMKFPKDNPAGKLSDFDYYVNELIAYRQRGGTSICDCSPLPFGGIPVSQIQQLSHKSGVQIITAAGYYTKAAIPAAYERRGEAYMEEQVLSYIANGTKGCDARPGFVKCAISVVENGQICSREMMAVRACAKAAKRLGMCLHIHTAFPVRKKLILDLAEMLTGQIGLEPARVVFCHMDSFNMGMGNPAAQVNQDGYDEQLPLELLKKGFNIGLDTWGTASKDQKIIQYGLNVRKKMLQQLLKQGYAKQITLGHDMMNKANGTQNHRSGYVLFPDVLQEMQKAGQITQEDIHTLTVDNPARILTICF